MGWHEDAFLQAARLIDRLANSPLFPANSSLPPSFLLSRSSFSVGTGRSFDLSVGSSLALSLGLCCPEIDELGGRTSGHAVEFGASEDNCSLSHSVVVRRPLTRDE